MTRARDAPYYIIRTHAIRTIIFAARGKHAVLTQPNCVLLPVSDWASELGVTCANVSALLGCSESGLASANSTRGSPSRMCGVCGGTLHGISTAHSIDVPNNAQAIIQGTLNTGRWRVGAAATLYLRHATINASEHPSTREPRPPLVFVDERARVHIHDSVLDGANSVRGLAVEHGSFVELHATIIIFCAATKGNGGGLLVNNSGVSLNMSAITNNGAANDGGAIHLTGEGSLLHVRGSVFEYNVVRSDGAAIFVGGGVSVDVLDSYFATNAAHGDGGAIFGAAFSVVRIFGSTTMTLNVGRFGGALSGSTNATIHARGATVLHNNTASEVRRVERLRGLVSPSLPTTASQFLNFL